MRASNLQVAALPVRWTGGRPEMLLVTTRGTGRWTPPKGWPLGDAPSAECAAREAFEEAGVSGRIEPEALGVFEYWKQTRRGRDVLRVSAFVLHVDAMARDWPERAERKRAWFFPEVAAKLVGNEQLGALIRNAALICTPSEAWPEPLRAAGFSR